jgi:hypothetical protein
MFIKWRKYQRQLQGKKYDKYWLQPIVVRSYRIGFKKMKEWNPDTPEEAYSYPEFKEKVQRPRHQVICKLPSYPGCMVVYCRAPNLMAQRHDWWERVDIILKRLAEIRDDMPPAVVDKLKAQLEEAVPRVTPEEEARLKVVFNDLPLHL